VDLVDDMLTGDGSVNPSLVNLYWLGLSSDPESHLGRAFVWACAYGRTAVVELLLAHGVDPTVSDNHGMTGLDWARANEHADIVKLLTGRRG
jgi:Ankyrin repeats (many copies)